MTVTDPRQRPHRYFVLSHSPGQQWLAGTPFMEQPGVEVHIAFMRGLMEAGRLALGGPFLDNSGGMCIARFESLEEAIDAAEGDESVKAGLLRVEVKPWLAAMDTISATT